MLSRTQALCVSADLFSACFCYGTSEGTFDLMQGVARYAVAAQRQGEWLWRSHLAWMFGGIVILCPGPIIKSPANLFDVARHYVVGCTRSIREHFSVQLQHESIAFA